MKQRRKLLARATALVGATVLALSAAVAVLGVHDESFELDGNTAPDAASTPIYDWQSLFTDSTLATVGGVTTNPLPAGYVDAAFVTDWNQNADGTFRTYDGTTFATGSKDTLQINTGWACVRSNNVNNKTDITNAYATIVEQGGRRILYFGLEKGEDNGNNNIGLWLLQNEVSCPPDAAPNGTAFSGVHAKGDLLLVSAFTNGGGVSNISAYQWTDDLDGDGTADDPGVDPTPVAVSADCVLSPTDDRLCATTNAESTGGTEFSPAWTHYSTKYGVNGGVEYATFFEGGIELTGYEEFRNSCFTGFLFNTRSSQELGATLFDYAQGDIDTCNPELSLDKEPETQTHNVGEAFDFTLTVTNDGDGPATDAVVSDTIPAGLTITGTPTVAPAAAGSCQVAGQVVTCTVDVAASDGNITAPEPDVVTITVPVTSTTAVFGTTAAGCVTVNNTGSVTVADDTNAANNSDTVAATICRPLVSKTAAGSYTHDVQWDISKSVDIDQHTLLAGESENSTYTVTVTKTVQDSGFAVTGTITVQNPNPEDPMTVDVTDALSSGQSLTASQINCGAAGDGDDAVIAANSSITCSYAINPANANAGTNTATATLNSIGFTGSQAYTFTPTNTGDPETINVTDTFDGTPTVLGSASSTKTFDTYTHPFACSTDETLYTNGHYEYTKNNTAKIDETNESASESVDTDCYIPTIAKTAAGSYTHGVDWTITKGVDIDQHTMLAGQDADSTYTVAVNKTVTDANFAVAGTITVTNPSPQDAMTVDVTDQLSSGQSAAATAISCGAAGDGDDAVIAAGGSITCTYSIATANANAGTNTATATFSANGAVAVSDDEGYTFTATNQGEPETITVKDNFNGVETTLGTASDDKTFDTYTHNFACSTDETTYTNGHLEYTRNNTASIVETSDSASESVDVDCYIPTITKSADGSFDRDWDWTIDKSADATNLVLQVGQSYVVNYTVTVDRTKTDSEFSVAGSITVNNPSPEDAMTVDVTDQLSSGQSLAATAIDCGAAGDGDNAVIAANGSITCTYDFDDLASVGANDAGTNTATATFSSDANVAVSDGDGYSYDLANETDECADVTDALGGIDDNTCADKTYRYTVDVGQAACGEYDVPNTASFVAKDQDGEADDTGSDSWNVHISIECQDGCTLTQGYWKTHSDRGPAPYDDTWALLDALEGSGTPMVWAGDGNFDEEDELFFSPMTDLTWYTVFWTAPGGNAYYNLAHQYQAAVLNVLNDAGAPQAVLDAISDAEALFEQYTPAEIGTLKGKKAPRPEFIALAGILAKYNEGAPGYGPGHCDEDGNSVSGF